MSKRSQDKMMRGIDALAKAMPNGQLFAAMGPLPFLGAAADHIAAQRAALATSQADITRLAAELAESTRALAVSQGEVERHRQAYEDTVFLGRRLNNELLTLRPEAERLRGGLERARGLLARVVSGGRFATGEFGVVLDDIRAFIASPDSPGAATFVKQDGTCQARSSLSSTPEPDRASPEATALAAPPAGPEPTPTQVVGWLSAVGHQNLSKLPAEPDFTPRGTALWNEVIAVVFDVSTQKLPTNLATAAIVRIFERHQQAAAPSAGVGAEACRTCKGQHAQFCSACMGSGRAPAGTGGRR